MRRLVIVFALFVGLLPLQQMVAHSAAPTTYSVGDVGPSGGFIAFKDEFEEYPWDYMEVSSPSWFSSGGFFSGIRALPFGQNASTLLGLSSLVGSSDINTQEIIKKFGDGWKISSIRRDDNDCFNYGKKYCKILITFENPIGVSVFGNSPDLPTDLPISCSGQFMGNIVNSGEIFSSGPSSIYFYENVATLSLYQDIIKKSDCKVTYQALLANEASIGGNSDWFLPSIGDLELIQKAIGPDLASLSKNGYLNSSYPSSNFKDANTQSLWGFYSDVLFGKKVKVDIRYSYYPILVRYFSTSTPVASNSYPIGCPSGWDPLALVNTLSIQEGTVNGLIKRISPKDNFEVIGSWTLEQSEDGTKWNSLPISGNLLAGTPKVYLSNPFYSIAAFGDYFRYRIEIEKKDCEKAILYSSAIQYSTISEYWPRNSIIDEYVRNYPAKFPTFKEVDALKKSITDIENWIAMFNKGTLSSCYLDDGTAGAFFFSDGETFGCKSDFENLNSWESNKFGAVQYNWRTLRVLPVDPKNCHINNTISENAVTGIFVKTEFGFPNYNPGLWVTSSTSCKVNIFLYDDWGWSVLETLELKTGALTSSKKLLIAKEAELKAKQEAELKAKQEADAKAAVELKAKQEADAKAAADKAAAELKAKQEAIAKEEARKIAEEARIKAEDAFILNSFKDTVIAYINDLKLRLIAIRNLSVSDRKKSDQLQTSFKIALERLNQIATRDEGVDLFDSSVSPMDAKVAALELKYKTITITCIKGKVTKKVTAVKPTCPAGYKKK